MHVGLTQFLILGGLLVCECYGLYPSTPPEPMQLTRMTGQISYNYQSIADKRRWELSDPPQEDYALILNLRSITMQDRQRRCTGYLELPEMKLFCKMSPNACFIYGSNFECSLERISSISKDMACNETTVFLKKEIRKYVNLRQRYTNQKSFVIDYKYLKCSSDIDERNTQPPLPPMTTSNMTVSSPGDVLLKGRSADADSDVDESQKASNSGNALIAVIVVLAVLLIISLLVILWSYRRNKRLEMRYALQSKLRYSLSNPVRDRKSTIPANKEQPCNNGRNNSVTPLHGEVIQTSNAGVYSEIGERNQGTGYQQPTQNVSNETLPDRIETVNPMSQNCVYAVVNKSVRRK